MQLLKGKITNPITAISKPEYYTPRGPNEIPRPRAGYFSVWSFCPQNVKYCIPEPMFGSPARLHSTALGQFWRPSDGSFSRVPRKKVELWPRVAAWSTTQWSRAKGRAAILVHLPWCRPLVAQVWGDGQVALRGTLHLQIFLTAR